MGETYFGENTGKLGFGLMRLPKKGLRIDVEQTKEMVDLFLDAGFTYFDTAHVYLGSEKAAKKALVDRHPRDSYTIATKLHAGLPGMTETKENRRDSLHRLPLLYGRVPEKHPDSGDLYGDEQAPGQRPDG